MGKEFELKYAVAEEAKARLLSLIEPAEVIQMSTTYYDTPDGALSARKWTLRLRQENDDCVVTFKTAGDGKTRGEWEYPADSVADAAAALTALGAPDELFSLLEGGTVPVCGAGFTRRLTQVQHGESKLELSLDEGILFRQERKLPICEAEIELKEGREEDATAYAEALAQRLGLTEEPLSKFVRAVRL